LVRAKLRGGLAASCLAFLNQLLYNPVALLSFCSPRGAMKLNSTLLKSTVVAALGGDRKSTRLNSSHLVISYAVFCLKKKIIYGAHDVARALRDAEDLVELGAFVHSSRPFHVWRRTPASLSRSAISSRPVSRSYSGAL